MGVNLNCDECGKFIRAIKPQEISKMRSGEETVCDNCLKMKEDRYKLLERASKECLAEINKTVAEAKARFDKLIMDRNIQTGRG